MMPLLMRNLYACLGLSLGLRPAGKCSRIYILTTILILLQHGVLAITVLYIDQNV